MLEKSNAMSIFNTKLMMNFELLKNFQVSKISLYLLSIFHAKVVENNKLELTGACLHWFGTIISFHSYSVTVLEVCSLIVTKLLPRN